MQELWGSVSVGAGVDGWGEQPCWGGHKLDWHMMAVLVPAQVCPCSCAQCQDEPHPLPTHAVVPGGGSLGQSPLPLVRQEMPLYASAVPRSENLPGPTASCGR